MTNAEKTQYAWDKITQEEVYIGNKDDWPSDANKRQDWRRAVPLRKEATKAVHGDGSARYRCCNDSSCSSQVLVAQKNIQKWNFRRLAGPGKPSACIQRGHYVGESSFHWKTTLEIKKLLKHKMNNKEKWLGRTIVKVEREVMRHFPVGKFGASLQPDLLVRFKDGDWLVIEVVYTHAPEKESHEAYDHARSACKKLGPRIIELHLNQCIGGSIDDDKHADWVRTGGMEKALEFEAELEQRTERYENRKIKFEEKERRRQDRAIEETITTCKRDFPHLKHLNPEIKNGQELQKIEDFFLLAHQIHNEFNLLAIEHETGYGLDPTKMKTIEEVKSSFEEKRKQKKSAKERMTKFKENYPNYSLPGDLEWKPESNDSFNQLLDEHESYSEQCIQYINETIEKMRDENCHSDIIKRIKEYNISSVERNFAKFKNDFTNHCDELKDEYAKENKRKLVEQFQKETGIKPTQSLDINRPEVDIEMIEEWFEKADKHQKSCSKILNEKMENGLPESVKVKLKQIQPDYNNQDVDQYTQLIDNEINRLKINSKIDTLQAKTGIKMPTDIQGDIALLDVEPWFGKAILYKKQCEKEREETLMKMKSDGEYSEYQLDCVEKTPLDYVKMDSRDFSSKLVDAMKREKRTYYRRRTRRDEPFNPFAPNAAIRAVERKERAVRPSSRPSRSKPLKSKTLADRQMAAIEALRKKKQIEQLGKNSPTKNPGTREDRLASLRAKSAANAQFAKNAKNEHEKKKAKAKAEAEAKANTEAKAEANKLFEGRINMKQIQQVGDSGQYCSISGITCLEDVRIKVSKNKFKLLFDEKKNRSNWSGYDVTVTKNNPKEKKPKKDSPYLLHCAPINT